MMLLSRIFVMEFGVLLLAASMLLARQVGGALRARRRRLRIEDAVLLAGALLTCGAYVVQLVRAQAAVQGALQRASVPGVAGVWVGVFGASCGFHVGIKALRALRRR